MPLRLICSHSPIRTTETDLVAPIAKIPKEISTHYAIAVISVVLVAPAFAASESYTIDPARTIPTFEVNRVGFTTQRGRFNRSSGKITLDIAARKGRVDIVIETGSLDMGAASWTSLFSDDGLFNTKSYPIMTFNSDQLIFDSDNRVVAAEGMLTLIGITQPVRVAVSDFKCGVNPESKKPRCAGAVSAEIKRSAFGLNKYLGAVDDNIKISVPVEAYMDTN